ncbi:MAG: anion permease, partial [Ruminococcus sp.]|nr:anion permease [Ruminococcus sp.]
MKKLVEFIKKETVLSIAFLLALISAFLVPIDSQYISYMDFRVLVLLFALMAVMSGLQSLGIFEKLSYSLLKYVKNTRSLTLLLVSLCFFLAMLITNDVALITFVPFTILILEKVDRPNLLIPVIVLETIAANLGSMLTPVGNPQNLYLYGLSGLSITEFLVHMAPATILSYVLLLICIFLQKKENIRLA